MIFDVLEELKAVYKNIGRIETVLYVHNMKMNDDTESAAAGCKLN